MGRAAHLLGFCPSIRLRRAALPTLHWFPLHVPHSSQAPALSSSAPSPESPRLWIWAILLFLFLFSHFSRAAPRSPHLGQLGGETWHRLCSGSCQLSPLLTASLQTCVSPATFPAALESSSPQPAFLHLPQHLCTGTGTAYPSGKPLPLLCITGSDAAAHHTNLANTSLVPLDQTTGHSGKEKFKISAQRHWHAHGLSLR